MYHLKVQEKITSGDPVGLSCQKEGKTSRACVRMGAFYYLTVSRTPAPPPLSEILFPALGICMVPHIGTFETQAKD